MGLAGGAPSGPADKKRPGRGRVVQKAKAEPVHGTNHQQRQADGARRDSGLGAGVDAAPQLAAEAKGDASAE